jgi:hypothetical protein
MQQTLPWITLAVQVVAFLLLYLHQRNIIKQQREHIESIKAFHQIFDLDKVKKYVELSTEGSNLEIEQLKKQVAEKYNDVEALSDFWWERWREQNGRIKELALMFMAFKAMKPKENWPALIDKYMPLNKEMIEYMDSNIANGKIKYRRRRSPQTKTGD